MAIVLGFLSTVYAADEAKFKATTFGAVEVEPRMAEQKLGPKALNFDHQTPGYQITATYTGKSRPLSKTHKTFIEMAGKSTAQAGEFLKAYRQEIEVKEGKESYWIPVQEKVFPYLAKELKPGDKFTMLLRYFGSIELDRMFLMIDFEKEKKS